MCVDMCVAHRHLGGVVPRHKMIRKASSQSQFCNEEVAFIVDTLSGIDKESDLSDDSSAQDEEHDSAGPVLEPLFRAQHGGLLPGLKRSLSLPLEWSASEHDKPADGGRTKRACSADDNCRFEPSELWATAAVAAAAVAAAAAAEGETEMASLPDADLYDGEEECESAGAPGVKQKKPLWTVGEERILLHLVWHFAERDLRWVAQVAQRFCGVRRSTRAVDKKLRRVLFYTRWQTRDNAHIRQRIRDIVISRPLPLSPEMLSTVQRLAEMYSAPPLPSLSDLCHASLLVTNRHLTHVDATMHLDD
jgi:hypothetical protein